MPITRDQINRLMQLQVQRDFFKKHAEVIAARELTITLPSMTDELNPSNDANAHEQFLNNEIEALRAYLRDHEARHPDYIRPLLLQRSTQPGISRNLGEHFAGLIPSASSATPPSAYVQLIEEHGLCFYWTNPDQAIAFSNALTAHGFQFILAEETLPSSYQNGDNYRTSQTRVVKIPHLYVEKLLALAQFHPYIYERTITELYEGKADRATCLLRELDTPLIQQQIVLADQESPVSIVQMSRCSLNAESDLIAVTVGAKQPAEHTPIVPHLILSLDDSGSMGGPKMSALNAAVVALIESLPDNTEVSIQALNKLTLAYRVKASALKAQIVGKTIPSLTLAATGGTPLLENIAGCAAFLRPHPLDFVIPQEEFDRAILVILTDGQPTGRGAVEFLVSGLQTSTEVIPQLVYSSTPQTAVVSLSSADRQRAAIEHSNISLGTVDFPCQQDLLILGFSIGAYGDTQFMRDLAKRFNTPQGFIRTEQEFLEEDMRSAVDLIANLTRGRVEKVVLGIRSTSPTGEYHGQVKVVSNLIYGYGRTEFFKVPRNSNLSFALFHGTQAMQVDAMTISNAIIDRNILKSYLLEEFDHLRSEYQAYLAQVKQTFAQKISQQPDAERFGYETVDVQPQAPENMRGRRGRHQAPVIEKRTKEIADYQSEIDAVTTEAEKQAIQKKLEIQQAKFAQAEAEKANPQSLEAQEENRKQTARANHQRFTTQLVSQIDALMYCHETNVDDADLRTLLIHLRDTIEQTSVDSLIISSSHIQRSLAGYGNIGRRTIAQYSQQRGYTSLPPSTVAMSSSSNTPKTVLDAINNGDIEASTVAITTPSNTLETVLDAINKGDVQTAENILRQSPELLTNVGPFGTPLHYALHQISSLKQPQYQTFFSAILRLNFRALLEVNPINGSSIAHIAAWRGLYDELIAIIQFAHANGQLENLLAIRNTVQIGGTTLGETFLDNIRMSPSLTETQKENALKVIWQAQNLQNHNCHDLSNGGNTLVMNSLAQLRNASDEVKRQKISGDILELIQTHGNQVSWSEANYAGNTALHFALWNEEYEIAYAIFNEAKKQGTQALHALLAARNTQGVMHISSSSSQSSSGGEVPHMNLVAKLKDLNANDVFEKIAVLLAICREDDSLCQLLGIGISSISTLIELLTRLKRLPVYFQKNPQHQFFQLIEYLPELIQSLEKIIFFAALYDEFYLHLDAAGKAELGHLRTVHQKAIEGYCTLNFLIQSPIVQLAIDHKNIAALSSLPTGLKELPAKLQELINNNFDHTFIFAIENYIQTWLKNNPHNSSSHTQTFDRQMLTDILIHLSLLKHYQAMSNMPQRALASSNAASSRPSILGASISGMLQNSTALASEAAVVSVTNTAMSIFTAIDLKARIKQTNLTSLKVALQEQIRRKSSLIGGASRRLFSDSVTLTSMGGARMKRDHLKKEFYIRLEAYLDALANPSRSSTTLTVENLLNGIKYAITKVTENSRSPSSPAIRTDEPIQIDESSFQEILGELCQGDGAQSVFDAIGRAFGLTGESLGLRLQREFSSLHSSRLTFVKK